MSRPPFIRSTENRALGEELRRLRQSQAAGTVDTALADLVASLAAQVSSLNIQLLQLREGGVVVRDVASISEEQAAYLEVDPNDFTLSGTGNVRRLDLGIGTTKGDLIAWNATPQPARLAVGTDGHILTADSAQALGVKWAAAGSQAVSIRKNSAGSVFTRSKINLIEGANVTLTVADDAGNDEIDVTIAASSGGGSDHQVEDFDGSTIANNVSGGEVGVALLTPATGFDLATKSELFQTIWNNDTAAKEITVGSAAFLGSAGARTDYQLAQDMSATFLIYDDGVTLSALPIAGACSGQWINIKKLYSDFAAASTVSTITLLSLPKRCIVHETIIKHSTSFTGGGTATCVCYVGTVGNLTQFAPPFDVRQATGNQIAKHYVMYGDRTTHNWGASENIVATIQTSGANVNALTAGVVEFWLFISSLP